MHFRVHNQKHYGQHFQKVLLPFQKHLFQTLLSFQSLLQVKSLKPYTRGDHISIHLMVYFVFVFLCIKRAFQDPSFMVFWLFWRMIFNSLGLTEPATSTLMADMKNSPSLKAAETLSATFSVFMTSYHLDWYITKSANLSLCFLTFFYSFKAVYVYI